MVKLVESGKGDAMRRLVSYYVMHITLVLTHIKELLVIIRDILEVNYYTAIRQSESALTLHSTR